MKRIVIFSTLMLLVFLSSAHSSHASSTDGTIDTTLKYAWSNNVGWINFAASTGNVHVTDTAVTGHVWSNNYGWINMNPTNGGVTNNGEGVLGGYAWGTSLGWINFSSTTIDATGHFHGTATGLIVGTLTFDCTHCAVVTDWRPVSVRTPAVVVPTNGGGGGGGTSSATAQAAASINSCAYPSTNENPDITGDGVVDIIDFEELMIAWGTGGVQAADITHDCKVDLLDFEALMIGWS